MSMSREEGVKRFLNNSSKFREILDDYIELRLTLKELGYSEDTIEKVETPEYDLLKIRQKLFHKISDLQTSIKLFFPNDETWSVYLSERLRKLNELYPLNDGSKERNNRGDEDLE